MSSFVCICRVREMKTTRISLIPSLLFVRKTRIFLLSLSSPSWHVWTRKNVDAVYICIEMSMTAAAVALEGKPSTTSSSLIVFARRRFWHLVIFISARVLLNIHQENRLLAPNGSAEIRNRNRNSLSSSSSSSSSSFITSRWIRSLRIDVSNKQISSSTCPAR